MNQLVSQVGLGLFPTFMAGVALSVSLIAAIGPQNAHLLRLGLQRQYLWTSVITSIVADAILISLGVLGLAHLGGLSPWVHKSMLIVGAIFLCVYGGAAAWRCFKGQTPDPQASQTLSDQPKQPVVIKSKRQAVMMALIFSWLNPHAWIDTAVLIGAASLAYQAPGNTVFGAGAMFGSALWFVFFGAVLCWLGARIQQLNPWRAIDGVVAVMMLGTAIYLVHSFFRMP